MAVATLQFGQQKGTVHSRARQCHDPPAATALVLARRFLGIHPRREVSGGEGVGVCGVSAQNQEERRSVVDDPCPVGKRA
jgi:hypothetical protein